jgi:hypothetical protein
MPARGIGALEHEGARIQGKNSGKAEHREHRKNRNYSIHRSISPVTAHAA